VAGRAGRGHSSLLFRPVFVTVANANDQYFTIIFHSVDHDVRSHGMDADWWRELGPLTGCMGFLARKRKLFSSNA